MFMILGLIYFLAYAPIVAPLGRDGSGKFIFVFKVLFIFDSSFEIFTIIITHHTRRAVDAKKCSL